jgi:hypothetical protein
MLRQRVQAYLDELNQKAQMLFSIVGILENVEIFAKKLENTDGDSSVEVNFSYATERPISVETAFLRENLKPAALKNKRQKLELLIARCEEIRIAAAKVQYEARVELADLCARGN